MQNVLLALALFLATMAGAPASFAGTRQAALADTARWRAAQDKKMRGPNSPFAVEAVQVLSKDENTIGSAPDCDIRLNAPGVAPIAAVAIVRGEQLLLRSRTPVLLLNGKPFTEHTMSPADRVSIGPFTLQFRRPGGKVALRISNVKGPSMRRYHRLKYFAPDLKYRVAAKHEPAAGQARVVTVEATQGGPQRLPYAGKLSFEINGKSYQLDAFVDSDEPDALFVIFKDQTNGHDTYPVGRYVYVPRPASGRTETLLDFNKAFNPLCAYGEFFFCPIPPKENRLPIPIPAGEKIYSAH